MVARRCVNVRAGYGAIHIPPISDGDGSTEAGEGRTRCHRPLDRRSLRSVDQPARAIEDVDRGNLEALARPVRDATPRGSPLDILILRIDLHRRQGPPAELDSLSHSGVDAC